MTPISKAVFIVADTETTGTTEQDEIVEVAAVATQRFADAPLGLFATLVRPQRSIPPEASAIHHLRNRDVAHAAGCASALAFFDVFVSRWAGLGDLVGAAHTHAFDRGMLERANPVAEWLRIPRHVCTERLARHLVPEGPQNYKNETLRYYFDLDVDTFGIGSHRALGDALVTAALLRKLLSLDNCPQTVEELVDLSASPIEYRTMPFGKHRSEPIDSIPSDYLAWCLRSMDDLSEDLRFTLQRSLQRRGALQRAG